MTDRTDSIAESSRARLMQPIEAQQLRNAVHQRVLGVAADPIRIGRYTVLKRIGSGGMGVVYAAYDTELDRKVAVKLLAAERVQRAAQTWRERLRREAQALAKLSHPNVVQVYDVGEHEGQIFLSMEFIDGPSLRQWARERRPWRTVVNAYAQAGRGLAAAHAAGIIHRDFKPENALVGGDDRVRVLDFGLARARSDVEQVPVANRELEASASGAMLTPITRSGVMMGTPAYMAPEQHLGEPADERTDQFNFCVALYEALWGTRPFAGATLPELRNAVLEGSVENPGREAGVPAWVRRVVLKGLSVDKSDRHASMSALLTELAKDPAVFVRRAGFGLVGLAAVVAGGLYLQAHEARQAERESELLGDRDAERERAENAERERDADRVHREDNLAVREARFHIDSDPTLAIAKLSQLSDGSALWRDVARTIAADAYERGIASRVLTLPEGHVPQTLSPDGRSAITRITETAEIRRLDIDEESWTSLGISRHGNPVVAYSPDAKRVAALRLKDGLALWDAGSLNMQVLGASPVDHTALLVSRAGVLAHGGDHPELHWWQGGRPQVLGGHRGGVADAEVSSDGTKAASVDGFGQLRVWDLDVGEPREVDGRGPLAFSASGALAAVIGTDVAIIDPDTGRTEPLPGHAVPVMALAFAPNGKWVAAGLADGGISLWDVESGDRTDLPGHEAEVKAIRFANNRVFGSTSLDQTLALWTVGDSRPQVLRGHEDVGFWAMRPDGTLVTMGWENQIRIWEVREPAARPLPEHRGPVDLVAYASASEFVTGGSDGTVRAWPVGSGAGRLLADHDRRRVTALAIAKNKVASADAGGRVLLSALDGTTTQQEVARFRGEVVTLAWSPNGQLAIGGPASGLQVVRTDGSEPLVVATGDFTARAARFSADGAHLITAGASKEGSRSVRFFDVSSGQPIKGKAADLGKGGVNAAAFSTDGRYVAYATLNREVHVWDGDSGESKRLGRHDGLVDGLCFCAEGRTLATAGRDGVVKLWNATSGEFRAIALSDRELRGVSLAPDSQSFAAVGEEPSAFLGRDNLPHSAADLRRWIEDATDLDPRSNPTGFGQE